MSKGKSLENKKRRRQRLSGSKSADAIKDYETKFVNRLLHTIDLPPTTKNLQSQNAESLSLKETKLNVLSILKRSRKTLDMIFLEVNLSRKAIGLDLIPKIQCQKIMDQLEALGLVNISKTPQSYYYLTKKAEPYL